MEYVGFVPMNPSPPQSKLRGGTLAAARYCKTLKVVCHLPTNSNAIFPRIGTRKSLFSPLDTARVLSELEIIIFSP